MHVAFRTDAALTIGTGHVMRCLTLARALALQGHNCRFVCRDLPGNLNPQVAAEFDLTPLPAPQGPVPAGPPVHAAWAGVDWTQDAAETRSALQAAPPDWLVLDHYAFDARWQKTALPDGTKLMVIDDLADRPHICDMLLDQNFGHEALNYAGLVPDGSICLTGPRYALLRPEFADLRAKALAARAGRSLRHLLISMGGVDTVDATLTILRALPGAPLPENLEIEVVMGTQAPRWNKFARWQAKCPGERKWWLMRDMRAWASRSGIGGGGTTWERCRLARPASSCRSPRIRPVSRRHWQGRGGARSDRCTPGFRAQIAGGAGRCRDAGRTLPCRKMQPRLHGEGVGRVLSISVRGRRHENRHHLFKRRPSVNPGSNSGAQAETRHRLDQENRTHIGRYSFLISCTELISSEQRKHYRHCSFSTPAIFLTVAGARTSGRFPKVRRP